MEVVGTDMGEIMGYLIATRRNIPIIQSFLGVDNKKVLEKFIALIRIIVYEHSRKSSLLLSL